MKKIFKWTLIVVVTLVVIVFLFAYLYMKGTSPAYEGEVHLKGIEDNVHIRYDNYGIPHITAANEADAYYGLGYVQAQDRLFQMDLLRRLTAGRLSEILGGELLETDKIMLTLGLREFAEKSAEKYMNSAEEPFQKAAFAYLAGINGFLERGNLPIEYDILKIPIEKFTPADIYSIINFMSLGFSYSTKEDALTAFIAQKLGMEYLDDWKLCTEPELADLTASNPSVKPVLSLSLRIENQLNKIGLSQWWGSNSWVIGPGKTKSGKVLFANDTHIGYGQPAVWYEAHITCPGFDFYGHYLPIVPFGVLGHNKNLAWGLTIFPFDNVNYYKETINPEDSSEVMFDKNWEPIKVREELIKVKDGELIPFQVKSTKHGPIVNDIDPNIKYFADSPISLWWTVLQFKSQTLQAIYQMNHSRNIQEFKRSLPQLDVVGLYINYGDIEGNYAWWATGKIPVLRDSLNTALFLDGSSGEDEVKRYLDFSENPQNENPEQGFIATANNDPVISGGRFTPGNYLQADRINRINDLISGFDEWDIEKMKTMQLDHISPVKAKLVKFIAGEIDIEKFKTKLHQEGYEIYKNWNGSYDLDAKGPVIFEKVLYHIISLTLTDELGDEMMQLVYNSFLFKRSINKLFHNENSVWWDNIKTESKETRAQIFTEAFDLAIKDLESQLGNHLEDWQWKKVHSVTYEHAFGKKKPMDKLFNVGPFPVAGGNNVLNKMEYVTSNEKNYKVFSGPTVRILIDFAAVEEGVNINPTGQSGNVMSEFYDDQAEMFINGQYRSMLMNQAQIEAKTKYVLQLLPEK